jgi:hypothetical protein
MVEHQTWQVHIAQPAPGNLPRINRVLPRNWLYGFSLRG